MSDLNIANKFELGVKINGPQEVNVTLIGINGANVSSSRYYITCWEGEQIGSHPVAIKQITFTGQSGHTAFDNLNLTEFPYTFSLGLGYESEDPIIQSEEYYPVSVTSTRNPVEGDDFRSSNPVVLEDVGNIGLDVRMKYKIPTGNAPQYFPQSIVMIKGPMDRFFDRKLNELIINYKVMSELEGDLLLPILERLRVGDIYTVAYVMGQINVDGENQPDLTKLAGWTEFVAE